MVVCDYCGKPIVDGQIMLDIPALPDFESKNTDASRERYHKQCAKIVGGLVDAATGAPLSVLPN